MKRSYVQIHDGQRYKLVPKDSEEHVLYEMSRRKSWQIMEDIKPYRSTIDGSEISSRSRHRAHLKAHGCIEVGNEWVERKPPEPPSAVPDILQAMERLRK